VVERKNYNIVGATREMLHDQRLRLHSWVEACNTMVYLNNMSAYWILGIITPDEAFSARKLDVSHFRIFGASIYCHVSKESRKNIELTIELWVFVGYRETPHNYHVYFQSLTMIVVRMDVKFDEDKAMRCSLERELQISQEEDILAPKEEPHDVVEKPQV